MNFHVSRQPVLPSKRLGALGAHIESARIMHRLHVPRQMITALKAARTLAADEVSNKEMNIKVPPETTLTDKLRFTSVASVKAER